jgi:hypothetical protein
MIKSLATSGFYNSSLVNKNLWASDFFNKTINVNNILESELNILYKNLYNDKFFTNYLISSNSLNQTQSIFQLFSFYESSYF